MNSVDLDVFRPADSAVRAGLRAGLDRPYRLILGGQYRAIPSILCDRNLPTGRAA